MSLSYGFQSEKEQDRMWENHNHRIAMDEELIERTRREYEAAVSQLRVNRKVAAMTEERRLSRYKVRV